MRNQGCPVDYMVDLISGKWKILIIWNLNTGKKRFGELGRILHKASKKMLSQQLKELEEDGLIHREVFPTSPPQVEYSLSEKGSKLYLILQELNTFAAEQIISENENKVKQ